MRSQFQKKFNLYKKIGGRNNTSHCLRPCHHIVIININRNKLNVDI